MAHIKECLIFLAHTRQFTFHRNPLLLWRNIALPRRYNALLRRYYALIMHYYALIICGFSGTKIDVSEKNLTEREQNYIATLINVKNMKYIF